MTLEHFPPTVPPAEVSDHLRRFGYAIVDDVIDEAVLDRLAEEVAPHVEASAAGRDDYDGRHTRRTGALIARCPTVRELVMHPLAVGTVEHFLGHATTVQLHLTQIITVEPGETRQKMHRDEMAFDYYPFPASYHVQCNTMWALTDFTETNGATHIAAGTSGLSENAARAARADQATMGRGSVLFYEGKVLHGAGANTSDGVRQGVNITYAVGWVRQEENQYLACPMEIARTLDDDLLEMMGYRQGAFALGYVGDQQDPLSVVRGEHRKTKLVSEFQDNDRIRSFAAELARDTGAGTQ